MTVLATVESVSERRTSRRNLRIIQARVSDASGGVATLSWFNQRYLLRTLEPGMLLLVRGEVRAGARTPEISVRTFEIVATPDEAERGEAGDVLGLAPVYHASSKISSRTVRDLAGAALAGVTRVGDPLPPALRVRAGLPLRRDAILAGHRPRTLEEARSAARPARLRGAAAAPDRAAPAPRGGGGGRPRRGAAAARRPRRPLHRRSARSRSPAPSSARWTRSAPIFGRREPMQRLLQGDVGSGKTAVALALLLRALESGGQAALMAPTEVLAVQHLAHGASGCWATSASRSALLTGDVPKKELDARRQRIAAGEPLIAIGTHALSARATSGACWLAVIDEQHRFGVDQREALGGGATPHVLHMTATPIPRSLALTLYGDLDVTVLDELPARPHAGAHRDRARGQARRRLSTGSVGQVQAGRQAYIVCPLVEELGGRRGARRRGGGEPPPRGPLRDVRVGLCTGR